MTFDTLGVHASPTTPGAAANPFDSLSLDSLYNNPSGMLTPPKSPQSTDIAQQSASTNQQKMVVTPQDTSSQLAPTNRVTSHQYQYQVPNTSQQTNSQHPYPLAQQQHFIQQPNQQAGDMAPAQFFGHPYPVTSLSPPISPLDPPSSPFNANAATQAFVAHVAMPPAMPTEPQAQNQVNAVVQNTPSNPFDVFGAGNNNAASVPAPVPIPETPAPIQVTNAACAFAEDSMQSEADFWSDMGFGASEPSKKVDSAKEISDDSSSYSNGTNEGECANIYLDERGLPKGGEYYNARVTTAMLGAIFSSGQELQSTLYSAASNKFVDTIGDRAVVSFTIDNSAADTAGIALGHVLLKVNGKDVKNTDDAVRLVGESPRPLIMEFYSPPNIEVVMSEAMCMVKYDTNETDAPASHCEWKPKYVVAGDMLGKAHVLYMYRSKAEYDIAVREAQTPGRKLSVKVKQFDIRGAKVLHGKGYVKYPLKGTWYYFTIIRSSGLPIKISATSSEELKPIFSGVTKFLDNEARIKNEALQERRQMNATLYKSDTSRCEGHRGETYY